MGKKVVMQDIADRLNLSKNSVSQALSGKDGVSEETRRIVVQTAKEMGYRYAKKSEENDRQSIKTIGLIASEYAFSMKNFFGEIYLSLEKEARRHGISLLIQSITPQMRDELILPAFIDNNQVDGNLILSHISTEYIREIIGRDIPTVLIDHHHPLLRADAVLTNNRFGAYTAIKHLLDLGHRDIGIIGDADFSPSYLERWEGYLLAFREYGLEPRQEWMLMKVKEEENAIEQLLSAIDQQPTAWFGINDGYSYYIVSALKQAGFSIPGDISVCGFDNTHFSQMSSPKLTTMEINLSLFAHKAFSQLLWRIENPDEAFQEILLPTHLLQRESTAASPPNRAD